jgi:hypothetical protein
MRQEIFIFETNEGFVRTRGMSSRESATLRVVKDGDVQGKPDG